MAMTNAVRIDKAPPQALEAEALMLVAMMQDPNEIDEVTTLVQSVDVYHAPHREVFDVLVAMNRKHELISMKTVAINMAKASATEGFEDCYLRVSHLKEDHFCSGKPCEYARMVAEASVRREMVTKARDVIEAAHDEEVPLSDVKAQAEAISQIDIRGKDMTHNFGAEFEAVTSIALDRADSDGKGAFGIMSGIRALDRFTFGWQGSTSTIIAARPGVGKTAIGLQFTLQAAKDGRKVGFFSAEMGVTALVRRAAGYIVGCDHNKYLHGRFSDEEYKKVAPAVETAKGYDIVVVEATGMKPSDIRAVVKKHKIELAVIDYLQILSPESKTHKNRETEVASISRDLKGIATRFNIPVLAICQLNRDGADREPFLTNLRESDGIGNDADAVLMLWRLSTDPQDGDKRVVNWKLEKNRHGMCNAGRFWYQPATGHFEECNEDYDADK